MDGVVDEGVDCEVMESVGAYDDALSVVVVDGDENEV